MFDFALPLHDSELIDVILIVFGLFLFLKRLLCIPFVHLGPKASAENVASGSSLKFLPFVRFNIVRWIAHFSLDVRDISVEENLLQELALVVFHLHQNFCLLCLLVDLTFLLLKTGLKVKFLVSSSPFLSNAFICYCLGFDLSYQSGERILLRFFLG